MKLIAAAVLMMAGVPAIDHPQEQVETKTAKPAKAAKRVCRTEGDSSSSRLLKKTCRTQAEWNAMADANAAAAEGAMRGGSENGR